MALQIERETLSVRIRMQPSYAEVAVDGALDDEAVEALGSELRALGTASSSLILDLRRAEGLDSDHLRRLLRASERARDVGWLAVLFP